MYTLRKSGNTYIARGEGVAGFGVNAEQAIQRLETLQRSKASRDKKQRKQLLKSGNRTAYEAATVLV